ncbi:hypothetical protein ACP275_08G072200 [Erythranthe tilingii]
MEDYLQLFVEETSRYNDIVLGSLLPANWWAPLPHFFRGWLRNYIGGTFIYLISGTLWCFYIYYLKRNVYLPKDAIPSKNAMLSQIGVAMKALPWYCAFPAMTERMIEHGWTKCFSRISDVGWIAYLAMYLVFVEFGIYWVHRELHDIKPLYKKTHFPRLPVFFVLSRLRFLLFLHFLPFELKNEGLAFHPLEGILQAMPHVLALFVIPTHFTTHMALLFIDAIWTANIHDCVHGKLWPVMGAGYHTIHHTTYRHNYGHFTIWMDRMFGTLRDPVEDEAKKI